MVHVIVGWPGLGAPVSIGVSGREAPVTCRTHVYRGSGCLLVTVSKACLLDADATPRLVGRREKDDPTVTKDNTFRRLACTPHMPPAARLILNYSYYISPWIHGCTPKRHSVIKDHNDYTSCTDTARVH